MGLISRHSGAPFVNGETLSGADLEQDFTTVYEEFNGNIDNDNVSSDADIAGSKLADGTVTNAKLVDDTVAYAKLNSSAFPDVSYVSATGTTAVSTSATLVVVPGLGTATVTAQSTADQLVIDCCLSMTNTTNANPAYYTFGFEINGVDTGDLHEVARNDTEDSHDLVTITHVATAPATGAITVVAKQRRVSGSGTLNYASPGVSRSLRVVLIPAK